MKTLKVTLVATLVAFMMVGLANADGFTEKPKKVMLITITKAMQKPDLLATMYQKLDPSFLNDIEHLYVVQVEHNWVVYRVLGSRQDWIRFFKMQDRAKCYKADALTSQ